MKKGKKNLTVLVLALEIATIVVLHTIRINQSEKQSTSTGKETSRNASFQVFAKLKSYFLLASLK
jgi:uncharacterized protein YpmS